MTTEVVLLLGIFVFLVGGLFFGEKGPLKVFENSGPRLGARVEKQITIGRGFKPINGKTIEYFPPDKPAATGSL